MKQDFLSDFIVSANDSLQHVSWMLERNRAAVLVLDKQSKYVGILSKADMSFFHGLSAQEAARRSAVEVVTAGERHPVCFDGDTEKVYASVRHIMADRLSVHYVPILNDQNEVIDIFSRRRAFYLNYYEKHDLPYMCYAYVIRKAMEEAKALGYTSISILEFGLAAGNSFVALEFHARELSRLYNIKAEVYGFDSGCGLPTIKDDIGDMPYFWSEGLFVGDMEWLGGRLHTGRLVIGDISETAASFLERYNPAPIGAVMVDVDLYSSTVPILKLLDSNFEFLMPRIHMYFDDILNTNEFAGETLAIKEFNAASQYRKISPEHCSVGHPNHKIPNIKQLHNFKHPLYNKRITEFRTSWLRPFV